MAEVYLDLTSEAVVSYFAITAMICSQVLIDAYSKNREASPTTKNSNGDSLRLLPIPRGSRTFAQFRASPSRIGSARACGDASRRAHRSVRSPAHAREWIPETTLVSSGC